jgi:hypothetical protein
MQTLEIRTLPIEQLVPAAYNPRKVLAPGSKPYLRLQASLREFGLVEPLIWNELTGHVVGGHARLRILKEMGMTELPVSVVRLSDDRERALNIVLNNQEAQGRYDSQKLAEMLDGLKDKPEFHLSGFDAGMLRMLKWQPAEMETEDPNDEERVEVTLITSSSGFDLMQNKLDELVREFDLETHVKRK